MRSATKIVFIICSLFLIYGCAPVISKAALEGADRGLGFSELSKEPSLHTDKTVVLGGTVIGVENLEDRTVVEVMEAPLTARLKPVTGDESAGRFLVEFEGFRDPVIYRGRLITVAGTVKGVEERTLGKMPYRYPVIRPVEHYLWRRGEETGPRLGIGLGIGVIHTN
ncbi:MAG TPA: Slp family lipoprotein [Thermodesulfobacteriota bacterium]|nr:Slp family lipoprotein [Thermodesulfobacteriota bacterium]